MISIKTKEQIELIKFAGNINYLTHRLLEDNLKVGTSTQELNDLAYEFITSNDCYPSFLNYNGFPASICISINDEIVHGIPSSRKLENGDVVSIDIGVQYKGMHSDSANTYIVGDAPSEVKALVKNTKRSLRHGLDVIKDGVKLNEIGKNIEKFAHKNNLSVIEELVGHGVGVDLHEEPDIPNFRNNSNIVLKEGMVLAIEPMLNLGTKDIYMDDDNWTIKTEDGLPSAHFEHTVLVTKNGYEIMTGE